MFNAIEDAQTGGADLRRRGRQRRRQSAELSRPCTRRNSTTSFSVAAITNTGQLWSNSNYGASTVTLAAPGVGILSTAPGGGFVVLHRHLPGRAVRHGHARPGVGSASELDLPAGHRPGDFHRDAAGEPQGQNDHRRHRQRRRRRRLRRLRAPPAPPRAARPVRAAFSGPTRIPSTASSSPSTRSSTRPSSPRRTSTSSTRPASRDPCSPSKLAPGSDGHQFEIDFNTQTAAGTYTLPIPAGVHGTSAAP